jgi:hypothetical protein
LACITPRELRCPANGTSLNGIALNGSALGDLNGAAVEVIVISEAAIH